MQISIDKTNKTALYKQIAKQIRRQVLSGEMPSGFKLPPERQLAETLGINRTTVVNAYDELKAEGLLGSHVGRGTVVLDGVNFVVSETSFPKEPLWEYQFSEYAQRLAEHSIDKALELANRKDVITFAAGLSSPEYCPLEAFKSIEKELIENNKGKSLLVSPVAGFGSLRNAISGLMKKRSCFLQPSEIMVLSGSQQGIDLVARTFVNPGDTVLVEEPSFFPAIQNFRAAGAKLLTIPMQSDGMDVDVLEQLLQHYQPKLIYTMPTYHNPCGITMSMRKRIRLVELAHRYQVPILEDDPYGELCFDQQPTSPLKSMDKDGYVIYISTFSKTIYSGLRLGWICAGRKIIRQFVAIRQLIDLHPNCMSQFIVERFIHDGGMAKNIRFLSAEYTERRNDMLDALKKFAPKGMTWNTPTGGHYIWCTLPMGIAASTVAQRTAERGVVVLPGTYFHADQEKGENYLRLNFTFAKKRILVVESRSYVPPSRNWRETMAALLQRPM